MIHHGVGQLGNQRRLLVIGASVGVGIVIGIAIDGLPRAMAAEMRVGPLASERHSVAFDADSETDSDADSDRCLRWRPGELPPRHRERPSRGLHAGEG